MQTFTLKNNTQVVLRSPQATDFNSFATLRQALATDSNFTLCHPNQAPLNQQSVVTRWADTNAYFVFAFTHSASGVADTLVAFASFSKSYPNHPFHNHIASFAMGIIKPYWGFGLGGLLLQNLIANAKTQNITRLEGYVRANNHRGINLYLKHGFTIEGCLQNRAFINNAYVNEYAIAKLIT